MKNSDLFYQVRVLPLVAGQDLACVKAAYNESEKRRGGRVPRYRGRTRPPLPDLPAGGGFRFEFWHTKACQGAYTLCQD